MQMLLIVSFPN